LGVLDVAGATVVVVLALAGPWGTSLADEANKAAAKRSASAKALEATIAGRLREAVPEEWWLRPPAAFSARREISFSCSVATWYNMVVPYIVTLALPSDRVGQRPVDFLGEAAIEIVATDGRYTLLSGPNYEPEIAAKILAVLGMPLSKAAEQHRLAFSAAYWLDFRCAVVRGARAEQRPPLPLAHGPTAEQIADYVNLFAEKGSNGGLDRGDPYRWFQVLGCCDVSPSLCTITDHEIRSLRIYPDTPPTNPYILLSDKPDEVLLNRSKRPRPWHFRGVQATRDAQGRPAVELEFDEAAAAGMERLTKANRGRALAIVFFHEVVQVQVIDREYRDKMTISGKTFNDELVKRIVRSLRECMIPRDEAAVRCPKRTGK
jgi:hypothetical protein